jgi:tetratricopeptide (TPR) repeat protein
VTELTTTTSKSWSAPQAFALAVFALLLGVCGGWMIRRSVAATPAETNQVASPAAPTSLPATPVNPNLNSVPAVPGAAELKQAADTQAAPLLEKLKADPNNAALLTQVGNLYYDAKEYPTAIDYYQRSLKLQPADTSVGTDLGTAYWYSGDADAAIKQFNKVLSIAPTKADTLFNLGIVEWQGKKDNKAAVAAWQKLLNTNPDYNNKDGVLQLIAQAEHP